MSGANVTVLAGSKPFTKALAALVAERVGEPPRIAADPGQAFAICRSAAGLLVFEYDAPWMAVLKDLGRGAARLRMIAAVPPAAADAGEALRALGVVAVPWEGDAAGLLEAIRPAGKPSPAAGDRAAATSAGPATPGPAPPGFFADVSGAASPGPGRSAPLAWPATAPSEEDAEHLLCSALAGLKAVGDPALDAVLVGLTPIEKQALRADPAVPDPLPLRHLAALRFRTASALASAPAPGSPVDVAAGGALLREIDGVLAGLKGLAEALPARGGEFDSIRRMLVKEAVDLSEVLHRLQPAAAAVPVPEVRTARSASTRLLSVDAGEAREERRRRWPMWVAFAAVLAAAAAFHVQRYVAARGAPPPPTLAGAPAGTIGTDHGDSKVLAALPGQTLDPAEVERFRALEEAKGNRVEEVSPGVFVVRAGPRKAPAPGGRP
jgi:hypothetical protein